jgi:hypothetical protein
MPLGSPPWGSRRALAVSLQPLGTRSPSNQSRPFRCGRPFAGGRSSVPAPLPSPCSWDRQASVNLPPWRHAPLGLFPAGSVSDMPCCRGFVRRTFFAAGSAVVFAGRGECAAVVRIVGPLFGHVAFTRGITGILVRSAPQRAASSDHHHSAGRVPASDWRGLASMSSLHLRRASGRRRCCRCWHPSRLHRLSPVPMLPSELINGFRRAAGSLPSKSYLQTGVAGHRGVRFRHAGVVVRFRHSSDYGSPPSASHPCSRRHSCPFARARVGRVGHVLRRRIRP